MGKRPPFAKTNGVKGFVLPEGFARAAQAAVAITGGNSLDRSGNLGERNIRVEQEVNAIGHEDASVQQEAAAKDRIFGVAG